MENVNSPASTFVLPPGHWQTIFECLCENFPTIAPERWRDRFMRGRVLDDNNLPLDIERSYRPGLRVFYFREVPDEKPIPFFESIIHADAHLIVVDKPHFLPVTPVGNYVEQTLLARLIKHFSNADIVPLHRIDRHTAGLVLFSAQRSSRAQYQTLFRDRQIEKIYEAIAPALPDLEFPLLRRSRIERGEPFFLSREATGTINTETRIEILERGADYWRYELYPVTGKKHQLRVHMAALGAPICNDAFYPCVREEFFDDYAKPLKLLARELRFVDPLTGNKHHFVSTITLLR
ncbi:MAG TPA: pseudouridine synthase [Spongiibacteraceae bacterium]|nr:pseudouridine synthase [Spongiibacteraceae bacterium]